ncbi:right-handed parallel beta-helix repeat-containing protein [Staphylospora marina]|uniref:right-handed parallel beta-helix repeat-containing protein n=1 Tax=Staphylospora marina TaxID=2490858 RepID=UPI000F5B8F70|nr:right-handed parallel beta-helix repeat-containing protein [Staphylospora marina]
MARIRVSRKLFSRYRSISQAIRDAVNGTVIEVEPGVYREELIIDRHVELVGVGEPGSVTVLGKRHAVVEMATGYAVLRNLTLKHSGPSRFPVILIPRGALVVEDCRIQGGNGPAVALFGRDAEPVFRRTALSGESNVAVLCRSSGKTLFEDCRIRGDSGLAAVLVAEGDPLFRRCVVTGDPGYGVFVEEQGGGRFEDCDFYGFDHSPAIGIIGGTPLFRRTRIHDGNASGVVMDGGKAIFEECVFFSLGKSEPAIRARGSAVPRLEDCVIKHCPGGGLLFQEEAGGLVDRCELYGFKDAPAVTLLSDAQPQLLRCRIHDGNREGVLVDEGGRGILESSEVSGFNRDLVHVTGESRLDLVRVTLRDGGARGAVFLRKSRGILQDTMFSAFRRDAAFQAAQASDPSLSNCLFRDVDVAVRLREHARGTFVDCRFEGVSGKIWDVEDSQPEIVGDVVDSARSHGIGDVSETPSFVLLFEELVGQELARRKILDVLLYVDYLRERKNRGMFADSAFSLHAAFLGPPDTGKTRAAELYGIALRELGMLTRGHTVRIGVREASDPVLLSRALDESAGGVLLAVDVHEWFRQDSANARSHLERCVKAIGGDCVLAVTGDIDPHSTLLPKEWIRHRFLFREYDAEGMAALFGKMAEREEYRLHLSVKPVLVREMTRLIRLDSAVTRGAKVKMFWEKVKMKHGRRCASVPKSARTTELLSTILPEDVGDVEFTEVNPGHPGWLDALSRSQSASLDK